VSDSHTDTVSASVYTALGLVLRLVVVVALLVVSVCIMIVFII